MDSCLIGRGGFESGRIEFEVVLGSKSRLPICTRYGYPRCQGWRHTKGHAPKSSGGGASNAMASAQGPRSECGRVLVKVCGASGAMVGT